MKIAIVNDIHIGKNLEDKGVIRASSSLVENCLPQILKQIHQQHAPDLLVNLGDLIRSEDATLDAHNYQKALTHFQNFPCPVLHLLGNHELKKLSKETIESLWHASSINQKPYGSLSLHGVEVIWLSLEHTPNALQLPQEELNWLKQKLSTLERPAFLFSHCAIDDQSVEGNYFYEKNNRQTTPFFFLQNREQIRDLLANNPRIQAVFQAHLHHFHITHHDHLPYITCPALADNITAPDLPHNIPEIYTIVKYEGGKMSVKVYSREYSFAGYN